MTEVVFFTMGVLGSVVCVMVTMVAMIGWADWLLHQTERKEEN